MKRLIIVCLLFNLCFSQNNSLFPKAKSKITNYKVTRDSNVYLKENYDKEDWLNMNNKKPSMYLFTYKKDIHNKENKDLCFVSDNFKEFKRDCGKCNNSLNLKIEDNTIFFVINTERYFTVKSWGVNDDNSIDALYLKELHENKNNNIKSKGNITLLPFFFLNKRDTAYTYPYFFNFFIANHDIVLNKISFNKKINDTIYEFNLQINSTMKFTENTASDYFYFRKIILSKQYGFIYIDFYRHSIHYQFWYKPYSIKNEVYNIEIE